MNKIQKTTNKSKSQKSYKSYSFKHFVTLIFVAVFVIIGSITIFQTFAAPGSGKGKPSSGSSVQLYLSPAKITTSVGATITVTVFEDSLNETVNAVQANIKYDMSALEYVSIDSSGSSFALEAQATSEGGVVKIARGHLSSLTGKQEVAKINFKVLSKFNRSRIDFTSDSAVVSSMTNTNVLAKSVGGVYSSR